MKLLILLPAILQIALGDEIHTYGNRGCNGRVQNKIKMSEVYLKFKNVKEFGSFRYFGDSQGGCGVDRDEWVAFGFYEHHDQSGQEIFGRNTPTCKEYGHCQGTFGTNSNGMPKIAPARCVFGYHHDPEGPTPPGKNATELTE